MSIDMATIYNCSGSTNFYRHATRPGRHRPGTRVPDRYHYGSSPSTRSTPTGESACSMPGARARQSPPPVLIPGIPTYRYSSPDTVPDLRAPRCSVLARRGSRASANPSL
jgi:hypothetical protein